MQESTRNSYEEYQFKQYFIDDPTYNIPYEIEHVDATSWIEDTNYIYIILSGIAVEKQGEKIIHILGANEFIGIGNIFRKSNNSSIMALTSVTLVKMATEDILRKLKERTYGMEILINVLNNRILELGERYSNSQNNEENVLLALRKLASGATEKNEDGNYHIRGFSEKMMANYLNLSIRQVHSVYNNLARNGYISCSSEEIILYSI
ncbi:Crp/Fnr family transcriptional regulator [Listeria weihenstephanensis]|uniref:Crp/Fnr family transcriptional regulator n=1 Tax=Listeria weihenstephanensis TaxID=1006155 RepID=A0A841ZBW1_9LIST|nr:Crp/Fnr family transcriptional regulator [Listeria weihenstephanensis]MBC1501977.1 Crp/Fnr family transcriptional regulator [Listeria weihenstephanensis]